jgi:hypothetical protein
MYLCFTPKHTPNHTPKILYGTRIPRPALKSLHPTPFDANRKVLPEREQQRSMMLRAELASKQLASRSPGGMSVAIINRDRLLEMVIAGLVGGSSSAAVGLLWFAGFAAEHVFSLLGALIGAVATVGGAIWVADRNANLEATREVTVMTQNIQTFIEEGEHALQVTADTDDVRDIISAAEEFFMRIRGSRLVTSYAAAYSKGLSFRQRAICSHMNETLETTEEFYKEVFDKGPFTLADEPIWREVIEKVLTIARDSLEQLRD